MIPNIIKYSIYTKMDDLCTRMDRVTVSHDYFIRSNCELVAERIYTEDLKQILVIFDHIQYKRKEDAILYLQNYIIRLPIFRIDDLDIIDKSSWINVFDRILSRDIKNEIRSMFANCNSNRFLITLISEWYISILHIRKTNKMLHHWF